VSRSFFLDFGFNELTTTLNRKLEMQLAMLNKKFPDVGTNSKLTHLKSVLKEWHPYCVLN
jgi:hypothetical protein